MTRARRDQRWREQAARLIASVHDGPHDWRCGFDVAAVRARCRRLLVEADELDAQRTVFADWTRERGLGPENTDPGVFVSAPPPEEWRLKSRGALPERGETLDITMGGMGYTVHFSGAERSLADVAAEISRQTPLSAEARADEVVLRYQASAPRGGWPGKLAREYAEFRRSVRRCPRVDCLDGVLPKAVMLEHFSAHGSVIMTDRADGSIGMECPECARFDAQESRAFVNGGNMRAAAQRLLDTLDGRCPWNAEAPYQSDDNLHGHLPGLTVPELDALESPRLALEAW